MTIHPICLALQSIRPGAQWALLGEKPDGTYTCLQWLDLVQIEPTTAEINAAIAAYVPPPDPIAVLQAQVASLLAAQANP